MLKKQLIISKGKLVWQDVAKRLSNIKKVLKEKLLVNDTGFSQVGIEKKYSTSPIY